MSDPVPPEFPPRSSRPGFRSLTDGSVPWQPGSVMPSQRSARWSAFSALAIALISVGIGIVGWFRPVRHDNPMASPSRAPVTEQQVLDAKLSVSRPFGVAKNEVWENTHRPHPQGDELGTLTVATDGHLALLAASDYLLNSAASNPPGSNDLTEIVRSLARSHQEFAVRALNGEASSALDPIRERIDADIADIGPKCT